MSPHIYRSKRVRGVLVRKVIAGQVYQKWFFYSNYPTEQDCYEAAQRHLSSILRKHGVPEYSKHQHQGKGVDGQAGIRRVSKKKVITKGGKPVTYISEGYMVTGGKINGVKQEKYIGITATRSEEEALEQAKKKREEFISEMNKEG